MWLLKLLLSLLWHWCQRTFMTPYQRKPNRICSNIFPFYYKWDELLSSKGFYLMLSWCHWGLIPECQVSCSHTQNNNKNKIHKMLSKFPQGDTGFVLLWLQLLNNHLKYSLQWDFCRKSCVKLRGKRINRSNVLIKRTGSYGLTGYP